MVRFALMAFLLAFIACDKGYHIPASVLDVYTSSNYCDSACVAELWLVKYNDDSYYGTEYRGAACPNMIPKTFYYTDGKQVDNPDIYNRLVVEGKYERILWQCQK